MALTTGSGALLRHAFAQGLPAANVDPTGPRFSSDRAIRGVNLGGWLLLEKWIAPSVFAGMKAPDEFRFSTEPKGKERLREHRENFIREEDFRWIAARGLDAVRLPVGYWILEDDASFVAAPDILDRAFEWAKTHRLGVLLDLHGAPGSQNGRDHSGQDGDMKWQSEPKNITKTLDVLQDFAKRYGRHPNLIGIEVLNEPDIKTPLPLLREFSRRITAFGCTHLRPFRWWFTMLSDHWTGKNSPPPPTGISCWIRTCTSATAMPTRLAL